MDCCAVAVETGIVFDKFQTVLQMTGKIMPEIVRGEAILDVDSDALSAHVWAVEDVDDERHAIC